MQSYTRELKEKVRLLRENGWSLGQIQREFGIPKTTVQSWISDIEVSIELQAAIKKTALEALQNGRVKAQNINKQRKVLKENEIIKKGIERVGGISDNEFFIAGVALYWAEGFKNRHEHRLGFCNSDPNMVRFYVHWLEKCLNVDPKSIVARLTLNKLYEERTQEFEKYWSQVTGIPIIQFTKPFYQNSVWKRQYNEDKYRGVLRIHVNGSLDQLLEMKGWIEGLKLNLPG